MRPPRDLQIVGPFLAIAGDVGEITLDFEEFDEVVKAVQILREQFGE